MNQLTFLQNQVFTQMIENKDCINHFSSGLKKAISYVGIAGIAISSALSTDFAMASTNDSLRAMLGLGAVTGLLSNNVKPAGIPQECNIQGMSGVTVGGAVAAGSYIGNQFGRGNGKSAMTVAVGLLSGGAAVAKENNRIEQAQLDCQRRIEAAQMRNANFNYQAPYRGSYQVSPNTIILYTYTNAQGTGQTIVTMENSPGMKALRGGNDGYKNPETDSQVANALYKASQSLIETYNNFAVVSDKYMKAISGNPQDKKNARYAVGEYGTRQAERMVENNKQKIQSIVKEWDLAYSRYAKERAFATAIFDNAAIDGYSLSAYKADLIYFQPPQNATVACQCTIPNRYATVPKNLTIDR